MADREHTVGDGKRVVRRHERADRRGQGGAADIGRGRSDASRTRDSGGFEGLAIHEARERRGERGVRGTVDLRLVVGGRGERGFGHGHVCRRSRARIVRRIRRGEPHPLRGRASAGRGAYGREGERPRSAHRAPTKRGGGQGLPIGDPAGRRRGGDRGRADRDRERVAGGRRRVEAGRGGLRGGDRSGADGEAGDHPAGRMDRGFAELAARVADRAVAAAREGRGDGVGQRGPHRDRGGARRGEGQGRRGDRVDRIIIGICRT